MMSTRASPPFQGGIGATAGVEPVLGQSLFLCRNPILDRSRGIAAYQLDFLVAREKDGSLCWDRPEAVLLPVILDSTEPLALTAGRRAFVTTPAEVLPELVIKPAWRGKIVFELLAQGCDGEKVIDVLKARTKGGLDLCLYPSMLGAEVRPFLSPPCFVKIDVSGLWDADRESMLSSLRAFPVTFIATGVETPEDFEVSFQAGFDLFQGGFYRKDAGAAKKSISPSQTLLLELSARTARDDDIQLVEAIFKKNPDLTFGLFNLMRAALFHLPNNIVSIRQAIALLGYKDLHRWVALMLFTIDRSDPSVNALFENVLVRARTMELAAAGLQAQGLAEPAYMSGIFSLVHALFDAPMEEIVERGNFGEEIKAALLMRAGRLGALLSMVEALERSEYEACGREAEKLGIPMDRLLAAQTRAILECQGTQDATRKEDRDRLWQGRPFEDEAASVPSGRNEFAGQRRSWARRLLAFFHTV